MLQTPVAIAMAGSSLINVMLSGNLPNYVVIHRMFGGIDSFPLLAVPFFIMTGNLMTGPLHPPMGLVLFVLARVSRLSFEHPTIAILPWLIPLLMSLALITYVPAISLWLPNMFM